MSAFSPAIRVLIADDHPVFRFGLRVLLQGEEDMEVVGEATTGREAVDMALKQQPDVVLMDLNLPEINGIEATRRIRDRLPRTAVLILTMFDDESSVFAAMRVGARGYLLKGAEGEETLRAVRAVASGEAIFSPTIADRIIHFFAQGASRPAAAPFPELTPREREVLALIAQGLTNQAIASRLVISEKTVRNHVSTIFGKLQVANRSEAIVRARDAGIGC